MKVVQQLISFFEQNGRLTTRQIEELVAQGYWGQYTSTTLQSLENKVGQSFFFQVTGDMNGPVWGSDTYTSDSNLNTASVHAGLLLPRETGVVKVTMVQPLRVYHGTARNGITTRDWTTGWPGAYTVELVSRPALNAP